MPDLDSAAGCSPDEAPVYLNVYDLKTANGYVYWAGLGIFHTGVEAPVKHKFKVCGMLLELPNKWCVRGRNSTMPQLQLQEIDFHGNNMLGSCSAKRVHGAPICKLQRQPYTEMGESDSQELVGSLCNCILPEALKASAMRHDPNSRPDSEKKRLRSASSFLSSMSMPHKEVPMSSIFLHSHYKGRLPPWELKRSKSSSWKESFEAVV
ncbi:hypothetical protein F3Y22_tig00110348pilonHSYRG00298 [Hibiscus syriacus]|uniref:Uncharacterized protein n=1 Tax=Hibiscus syriacus TaxID=106335 RepID=A0A6A3AVB9_HIBSY|nr:hypothetical protein F3Y22_tig00110348pilonHSYRG00298 [Hibiscus syriacus]